MESQEINDDVKKFGSGVKNSNVSILSNQNISINSSSLVDGFKKKFDVVEAFVKTLATCLRLYSVCLMILLVTQAITYQVPTAVIKHNFENVLKNKQ